MSAKKEPTLFTRPGQWMKFECVCGKVCGVWLAHYDVAKCERCAVLWWALRPRRNGPMVAMRHPGWAFLGGGATVTDC